MTFDENEKLTLFLIWCIGERGLSIDFHDGFGDKEINLWITSHGAFLEFLSQAYEAKEEYEFYVDDYELSYIKKNKSSCICLEDSWSDGCKNKITITID